MKQKVYKISKYNGLVFDSVIKEVEAVSVSPHSIWLPNNLRERRETQYYNYFETKHDAYKYMLENIDQQVFMLQTKIDMLNNLKGELNENHNY